MARFWVDENGRHLCWANCYINLDTHTRHEDYAHFLTYKYQQPISIHDRDLTSETALEIERWCKENFGKLDEFDGNSVWQVAYTRKASTHIDEFDEFLVFLFHKKADAAFFKLTWC